MGIKANDWDYWDIFAFAITAVLLCCVGFSRRCLRNIDAQSYPAVANTQLCVALYRLSGGWGPSLDCPRHCVQKSLECPPIKLRISLVFGPKLFEFSVLIYTVPRKRLSAHIICVASAIK